MLSISQLETEGLGHHMEENAGRRGRFQVERVDVSHPWSQQRQTIYAEGRPRVDVPVVSVHIEECLRRAEQLNQEQITLHFITPTRLVERGHLVQQASPAPLVQRLLTRYLALETHYGTANLTLTQEEKDEIQRQAEEIVCSADRTQWQELTSYSNRQKRSTPIGGLVGKAAFRGDLAPLLPLLVIGELIHVGKDTVKGNGWYRIETEGAGEEG